jgi:hypothetical protein
MLKEVLRIRDVYPGSRIRLFTIPDPGFEVTPSRIQDPGSLSKNLSILTPKKTKNGFSALKNMIRFVHTGSRITDPDADFLPSRVPGPGYRGQKAPDPGSRIRIRNTG